MRHAAAFVGSIESKEYSACRAIELLGWVIRGKIVLQTAQRFFLARYFRSPASKFRISNQFTTFNLVIGDILVLRKEVLRQVPKFYVKMQILSCVVKHLLFWWVSGSNLWPQIFMLRQSLGHCNNPWQIGSSNCGSISEKETAWWWFHSLIKRLAGIQSPLMYSI